MQYDITNELYIMKTSILQSFMNFTVKWDSKIIKRKKKKKRNIYICIILFVHVLYCERLPQASTLTHIVIHYVGLLLQSFRMDVVAQLKNYGNKKLRNHLTWKE